MMLCLFLLLGGACAVAETTPDYDTLVVGTTSPMSGNFFGNMFGSNAVDIDVQALLHDYNLMGWSNERGAYGINTTVVSNLLVTEDVTGDRTYTVTICDDLYYSDGTHITAADYAFSILLSIHPALEQLGAHTTGSDYIVGVDSYKVGKTDVLAGVRLLDDQTLAIRVKSQYQPYFYELGLLDCTPYPIHVIVPGGTVVDEGAGVYVSGEPITAETLRETMLAAGTGYVSYPSVVSGPYQLDAYDAQAHQVTFSMNPYYKGSLHGQKPSIQKIVFKMVSTDTMMDELERGEINLISKLVAANQIDRGLELNGVSSAHYPRSGLAFISFNCETEIVGDATVRQAIAHCFDKDAVVASHVRDYGVRVDGYYGIGQWVYALAGGKPVAGAEPSRVAAAGSVSLDSVKVYDFSVDQAVALLESAGWTLNRSGAAFDPAKDDVRCKEIGGELKALELKMIYPATTEIGDELETLFVPNLKQAGIALTVEAVPGTELLERYYRTTDRDCDMIFIATNFGLVFDPSSTYSPEDAYQGLNNRSGLIDNELFQRAVAMRQTNPGDVQAYSQKWVAFQQRWAEVLPSIPVYSNEYYDFYTDSLQNYAPSENLTWAQAIIGATYSAPAGK